MRICHKANETWFQGARRQDLRRASSLWSGSAPFAFPSTLWYKVTHMEVERALADLAEVRDRLASVQEFRGFSGSAAALSGVFALIAGGVQLVLAPAPESPTETSRYLFIWSFCLATALLINYGALLIWYVRSAGRHERRQTRAVGITILPAIGLGAVLSMAVLAHGMSWMLPGIWYASYGIGLFSSRAMLPKGVIVVASIFGLIGAALILTTDVSLPLRWWVMPLGFGILQIIIGYLLTQEKRAETFS